MKSERGTNEVADCRNGRLRGCRWNVRHNQGLLCFLLTDKRRGKETLLQEFLTQFAMVVTMICKTKTVGKPPTNL